MNSLSHQNSKRTKVKPITRYLFKAQKYDYQSNRRTESHVLANKSSPRNGSKIKPANTNACRQSKVRKRGKGVKEKRIVGGRNARGKGGNPHFC